MSSEFVLHRGEPLDDAFRRIADEQLTRAAAALTSPKLSRDARVHEARKRFKESRALMRLYGLDERCGWYRDAGRALSKYRDATAVVEALEAADAAEELRAQMRERCEQLYADVEEAQRDLLQRFAAERLALHGVELDDAERAVERGLAAAIRRGRRAMRLARETRTESAFHEWRKRVKNQWYHARLFRNVSPRLMRLHESALHELSDVLGHHHDLTVVRGVVEDGARFIEKQRDLEEKAWPVAQRVYAGKARGRAKEIMDLWRAFFSPS